MNFSSEQEKELTTPSYYYSDIVRQSDLGNALAIVAIVRNRLGDQTMVSIDRRTTSSDMEPGRPEGTWARLCFPDTVDQSQYFRQGYCVLAALTLTEWLTQGNSKRYAKGNFRLTEPISKKIAEAPQVVQALKEDNADAGLFNPKATSKDVILASALAEMHRAIRELAEWLDLDCYSKNGHIKPEAFVAAVKASFLAMKKKKG